MFEKTANKFKSPDLQKMRAVKIDHRTIIYIPLDDDPVKAKLRYLERNKKP